MTRKRIAITAAVVLILTIATVSIVRARSAVLVLTGIVTTNDVTVSSQVTGLVARVLVNEGDSVARDQLLAVIAPGELQADRAYYEHNAEGVASQVRQSAAELRYQEAQTTQQIRQADAMLSSASSQHAEAVANLEIAKLTYQRQQQLLGGGGVSPQEVDQARTAFEAAQARADAAAKQVEAQRAAVALAHAAAEQNTLRRNALGAAKQQQQAAAAQTTKADVRLAYSEIRAPVPGIVDVRAVRQGEVVTPGQPMLTLINPDDLWVRFDIEETYIERVRLGDTLRVRLPSGDTVAGTVFFRGIDANFATQRDVSRTKRDIKTFEIRLRVHNRGRRLAVGMTAYVLLPVTS
jgi:HlyD family secretion protein